MISRANSIACSATFGILGRGIDDSTESALRTAIAGGAVFQTADGPLSIFHEALALSIRDIETHPRGRLFQEFLLKGPYEDAGEIPGELLDKRLSDSDTASAITFIHAYMVNCFKGAVAELLASAAIVRLVKQLKISEDLPDSVRVYIGDTVVVQRSHGEGFLKGADMHILITDHMHRSAKRVTIAGVAEVKSYSCSQRSLRIQLDRHVERTRNGLQVAGDEYSNDCVDIGFGTTRRVMKIAVLPSGWLLPRTFHLERQENGRRLHIDPGIPPKREDEITRTGEDEWRITLRWSGEAIAVAAYEMTFWYMEKVGEVIYSKGVPREWAEMNPLEAGMNATKLMLYYATLRCRTAREQQRAIALYNSYGFGYALGMSFRNHDGRREMLWAEDLDEILSEGKTKGNCRIF